MSDSIKTAHLLCWLFILLAESVVLVSFLSQISLMVRIVALVALFVIGNFIVLTMSLYIFLMSLCCFDQLLLSLFL